jgi:DNA-binding GntR family transcriptional regulator
MANRESADLMDRSPDSAALYEQLADVIRQRIADGTYQHRIPSIVSLSDEFSIGRITAYSALRIVADRWGLVTLARGRGYYLVEGAAEAARDRRSLVSEGDPEVLDGDHELVS